MFCQKCGTQNEEVARFCANCGETLDLGGASSNQAGAAEAPAGAEFFPQPEAADANNSKKIVKIAIAAVVAIIVVVLGFNLISGLFGGGKVNYEKHPVVYNKDGDIMVQLAGKANPEKAYELGSDDDITTVRVTDDGKYIFYGDDWEITNGEYDLCYRKVSDTKGNSVKDIDSGVTSYQIAPNGKMVVYTKGDKLYISNLKKSEQIDKDVYDYSIIGNGKYVLYTILDEKDSSSDDEYSYSYEESNTYELHICKMSLNAEPDEISDGVSSYYVPYDEETGDDKYNGVLYYKKDGDLYYVKNGKNPENILSDVGNATYLDGKFFAATVDEKTVSEEDAFVVSEDEDGYETREVKPGISSEYDSEKGEYVYKKSEYTIYTVDGKKTKALEGTFTSVSLSAQYASNDEEYFVLKKDGKLISIGEIAEDADLEGVSEDEKLVYLIEDIEDDYESKSYGLGTLNSYKLTSKGLGTKKEIAKDVSSITVGDNGEVRVYTKDGEDEILNVYYKNKYYENIGENVEVISSVAEKSFYFLDDCEGNEGTLMRYTLGKAEATKIDDDVVDVNIRSDKMVYYIADWDNDDGCGTLFLAKGNGEPKVVDEEVKEIRW